MLREKLKSLMWSSLLLAMSINAAEPLRDRLQQSLEGTKVPAMAAVVIRDGKVLESAAVGVRRNDSSAKVTDQDSWLLGSTSKTMTVAAVARLVERGVLSWQTPLDQMLPELAAEMRPEYQKVTLVELLSHRSGLPENLRDLKAIDPYFDDSRPLPEQRLAYIREALQEQPEVTPKTAFSYSNTGFLIAAAIAERALQRPFEQILRDEVFVPLNMRSAGFGPTASKQPQGHHDGKPKTSWHSAEEGVPPMFSAAGYIHMSTQDWARFCIDQLAGARGQGALLKPESYRLMQTAQGEGGAGLDWGIQASIAGRKGPVLVHGGSDGNWLAYVVLFPQTGNGVLVVANAAEDMGADQVIHSVLGGLLAEAAPAMTE